MKLTRMQQRIKQELVEKYESNFETATGVTLSEGTMEQKYNVLVVTLRELIASNWIQTKRIYSDRKLKQVYYLALNIYRVNSWTVI